MTPEQRSSVLALVARPGTPASVTLDEFLGKYGVNDGTAFGADLLRDGVARRDPVDVELALVVCFKFGFSADHLESLLVLASADWHQRHEDVATALGRVGSSLAVDALHHLATWVPDYLEFDDARALATKAVWALGSLLPSESAQQALEDLSRTGSDIVAQGAKAQLQK